MAGKEPIGPPNILLGPLAVPVWVSRLGLRGLEWVIGDDEPDEGDGDPAEADADDADDADEKDSDTDWDVADVLGVLYLLWRLWEWLGTNPSIGWDLGDFPPIYGWTPEDPDPECVETLELRRRFFHAPVPFAARICDPMAHGGFALPGPGSPDVLIEGLPALRTIDQVTCPVVAPLPHTPGAWVPGQTDVLVNGAPLLRAGDFTVEMIGGPNPIVAGAVQVIVGPPVLPVAVFENFGAPACEPEESGIRFRWEKIEFLKFENVELEVGLSQDGPFVGVTGDVTPAHLYGQLEAEYHRDGKVVDVDIEVTQKAEVILGKTRVEAKAWLPWWKVLAIPFGRRPKLRDIEYSLDGDVTPIEIPKLPKEEIEFEIEFDPPF